MGSENMERLEILRQEHDRLGAVIIAHYSALDRVLGLALVVLGGAALFGENLLSLVFIPMGLGLVGLYSLDLLREITMSSGYKRHLELLINRELKSPDLLWECWISEPLAQRGKGKQALFALYFGVVVAASTISLFAAVRYSGDYDTVIQGGAITFWCLFWTGAIVSAAEGLGGADLAYAWASSAQMKDLPVTHAAFRSWRRENCLLGMFVRKDAKAVSDGEL